MRGLNITNNTTIEADAFYKYVRSFRDDSIIYGTGISLQPGNIATTRGETCDYVYVNEHNEIIKKEDYDWLYKLIG